MGKFTDALQQGAAGAINGGVGAIMGLALGKYNDRRQLEQQEKLQDLQNRGSKELMDYQSQSSYANWLKTGPKGQMEQLKAAGLNPALMYGMGGGTGGQSMTPGAGPSGAAAPAGGGEVQAMGMLTMQQRMAEANIELMKSQAKKNTVEAENISEGGIDTQVKQSQIGKLLAETTTEGFKANPEITAVVS